MNSKYAPIIALAALGIALILGLGWFLAISPKLGEAAEIREQSDAVDANTAKVTTSTAKLAAYEQELEALAPLDESLALNLPPRLDVQEYRTRITDAVESSKVEIVSLELEGSYEIDGWLVPQTALVSTSVARLFQDAPVVPDDASEPEPEPTSGDDDSAAGSGDYEPPVTVSAGDGPVVDDLWGVPVTFQFAGSYSEMSRLFAELNSPSDQFFLVNGVEIQARNGDAPPVAGIADGKDGDVMVIVQGVFYLLNPDITVIDEAQAQPVTPSSKSPFVPGKPSGKQPGAN